jgi:HlyD family secretion protein
VKKGQRTALIAGAFVVIAGAGIFLLRGSLFPRATPSAAADPAALSTVKVTRGNLAVSVAASGQLEPNTITTIRPDSNMPTRKLVKLLVKKGERVREGQALAEVDSSGLEFDLQSARANLQAQRVKLANLQARPQGMEAAAADATLASARSTLDAAQEGYDNVKALFDKDLSSRKELADAERALNVANLSYTSAQLSYQNAKAQNADADIQAQQSVVSSAQSELQKAQLIYDSITIRSPLQGVVADVGVVIGDLISPSTALMTVIDPDPMWLLAEVNESDIGQIKVGQGAAVVPSGYSDLTLQGRVIQIDLHATVQSNVSVFTATVEVPNRDGKLLWGMNADADISVFALNDVLTLPANAIKTANGTSTVVVLDGGQQVTWDVQAGATDGSRTQVVAGLDEGDDVVVSRRNGASATAGSQQRGGPGGMGAVFGIMR